MSGFWATLVSDNILNEDEIRELFTIKNPEQYEENVKAIDQALALQCPVERMLAICQCRIAERMRIGLSEEEAYEDIFGAELGKISLQIDREAKKIMERRGK